MLRTRRSAPDLSDRPRPWRPPRGRDLKNTRSRLRPPTTRPIRWIGFADLPRYRPEAENRPDGIFLNPSTNKTNPKRSEIVLYCGTMREKRRVQEAQKGDNTAFERLVEEYQPKLESMLLTYLHRLADVQDAVQETFLRAVLAIESLRKPDRFGPWLMAIGRNVARNWISRERKRRTLPLDSIAEPLPPGNRGAGNELLREALEKAFGGVEVLNRQILFLHYFDALSCKRISNLLSLPEGTVKRKLHEARGRLKEILTASGMKAGLSLSGEKRRKEIMDSAKVALFTNRLFLQAFREDASAISLSRAAGKYDIRLQGRSFLRSGKSVPSDGSDCDRSDLAIVFQREAGRAPFHRKYGKIAVKSLPVRKQLQKIIHPRKRETDDHSHRNGDPRAMNKRVGRNVLRTNGSIFRASGSDDRSRSRASGTEDQEGNRV